jgi:hypothetical protein
MELPDITPAQWGALAAAVVGALVILFKLDLSDGEKAAAVAAIAAVLTAGWQLADALIRHGRSRALTPVAGVAPSGDELARLRRRIAGVPADPPPTSAPPGVDPLA